MKNTILLLFALLMAPAMVVSQDGTTSTEVAPKRTFKQSRWYVSVGGGYLVPFFTSNRRSPFPEKGDRDVYEYKRNGFNIVKDQSIKGIIGTFGRGFDVGLSTGYMFTKHFGFDLSLAYSQFNKDIDARVESDAYDAFQKTGGISLSFSPALTMRFIKNRVALYNKVGLILPIYTKLDSEIEIYDNNNTFVSGLFNWDIKKFPEGLTSTIVKGNAETSLKTVVGLKATLGLEFFLTDRVSIIADATAALMNIKIKQTNFTDMYVKYAILDILPVVEYKTVEEVPAYLKNIVWVDEITNESNNARYNGTYDMNKPQEEVGQKVNISSIFINIGFKFNLGKETKK